MEILFLFFISSSKKKKKKQVYKVGNKRRDDHEGLYIGQDGCLAAAARNKPKATTTNYQFVRRCREREKRRRWAGRIRRDERSGRETANRGADQV